MTAAAWVIVSIIVIVTVGYVCNVAYARGYAAGQSSERKAIARVLNDMRQRTIAAERDIDYLYERACWQIAQQSQAAAPTEK